MEDLHLLVSRASGDVARRAAEFAVPPSVWDAGGRAVRPASPIPVPPEAAVPAAALALLDVLSAAGAEPVAEHGVLAGEVLGLEVARVAVKGPEAWLEVGVGKHDREAQRLVHGDRSPLESLAAAVSEESDTLEDVYEPYLIQEGFLMRSSRGRMASRRRRDECAATATRRRTDSRSEAGSRSSAARSPCR